MTDRQFASHAESARFPLHFTQALLLVTVLSGCGGEASDSPAVEASKIEPATTEAPKAIDHEHPVVLIETDRGTMKLRLDAIRAPGTVRNFLNYANSGFYDNTLIHYVDRDKMVAGGGYSTDRALKPPRLSIRNEAHNGLKNVRGTIAMARDRALIDSATSQFFINLEDAPSRDYRGDAADEYGYCVFGEVVDGLNVAERISQAPTADLGGDLVQTPDPPVVVTSVRIVH